ncbi:MAG: nucleotide pyrophosphohydrolase [SAR324 cluster bacterium]|nr:nucleotide pyrophosphohydrolase [SAR324 cluster bacterium]
MKDLKKQLRLFAAERDWDQFHSPKNLSMAMSVEAAEILEIFQWMSDEESRQLDQQKLQHLEEEIGDVMNYLVALADKFGMDPLEAARKKIKLNAEKYPASRVRGSAKKYDEYSD